MKPHAPLFCPRCGNPPILYWFHTLNQSERIVGAPERARALRLTTKEHKDARPCYGCHPCNLYTAPYVRPFLAARAWREGKFL